MRLFLALNIDPDVRQRCHTATAPLRVAVPDLRWVAEPKLHLTLKFLGEQPEAVAPRLAAALDAAAPRSRVMDLAFGEVGTFPNFRRPRIVWLGVTPDPKLELLHHDIEVACDAVGLPLDGRAFRPHVTLGRAVDRATDDQRRALRRAARTVVVRAAWSVETIDLMQSIGGEYRVLHRASLAPARD